MTTAVRTAEVEPAAPAPVGGAAPGRLDRRQAGISGMALRLVVTLLFLSAFVSAFARTSEILIVLAALVAYMPLVAARRWHAAAVLAAVYLAYWALSMVLAGAWPQQNLLTWLNDDGHTVVGLLPFLLLSSARPTGADMDYFSKAADVATWLGGVLLLGGFAHAIPGAVRSGLFFGLTSSHHVPGYIYSTLLIYLFADQRGRGSRTRFITICIALALIGASGSRTSIIGLVLAGVVYFLRFGNASRRLKAAVAVPAVLVLAIELVPHVGSSLPLASRSAATSATSLFQQGASRPDISTLPRDRGTNVEAIANAQNRFAIYGFAFSRWERSPLFGIGSTRFDDVNLTYEGQPGVVDVVVGGTDLPQYSTAHNDFLHTLAENGLVGLMLLLSIYWAAYRRCARCPDRAIQMAGMGLVVFAFGTALTGSTLTATSLTFETGALLMVLVGRARELPRLPAAHHAASADAPAAVS